MRPWDWKFYPQITQISQIQNQLKEAGRLYFPGYMPGSEDAGWSAWITGAAPRRSTGYFFGTQYFSNMVYEKGDWVSHLQLRRGKQTG